MYTEFVITMTIPAVGLVLIIVFYCGRLWTIRQAARAATEETADAETGALQKQGDTPEDTNAAAVRSHRCVALPASRGSGVGAEAGGCHSNPGRACRHGQPWPLAAQWWWSSALAETAISGSNARRAII